MKKVWMNIDKSTLDISYMVEAFQKDGYEFITEYVEDNDEEGIIRLASNADAVISGLESWNERTIPAVKDKMKFILRFGTGYDNVNVPCATENGILVANIPGANASGVAEIALLHILNAGRKFTSQCYSKEHGWTAGLLGTELRGKTLGLIGFGNIAKILREYVRGFGVKVVVYDPYVNIDAEKYEVEITKDYREIFKRCDFVSLHVPCTEQTENIVCEETLGLMKKSAYLINTARGGLVDEDALYNAIITKRIAGAGLDVVSVGVGETGSKLLGLENVTVSPHLGGCSIESVELSLEMLVKAIEDYFNGKIPFHALNAEVLNK